tara:strand:+ start:574 stop:1512 length:939 start_codon:yes stop_codon:yes gene_type:complete
MIKIAIIGAGYMAEEHIKAFQQIKLCQISAIISRSKEKVIKLAKKYRIPNIVSDIGQLKKISKANLVVVTVPEIEKYGIMKRIIIFDWLIFIEKPVGYNLVESNKIELLAKINKRKVLVAHNRRFYSSVMKALKDIEKNNKAKRFIHIQDQQSFEEARRYNHPEKVVKNFMYANSIHLIDLIFVFCRGKVKKIQNIKPWKGERTEIVLSFIEFSSGDSAIYEGIWKGPGPWSCTITTKDKRWSLKPLENLEIQEYGSRCQNKIPIDSVDFDFKPGLIVQSKNVINFLKNKPNTSVTISESNKTMKLIKDIFT